MHGTRPPLSASSAQRRSCRPRSLREACSMSSRCLSVVVLLVLAAAQLFAANTLKVCADPHLLPFSNQRQQGFENKIADILGEELGATVAFEWVRPSRGFVREVVNTG